MLCTYNNKNKNNNTPPHLTQTNKNDIKRQKTQRAEKLERTGTEIKLSNAAK